LDKLKKIGFIIGVAIVVIIFLILIGYISTENNEGDVLIEENTQKTLEGDLTLSVFDLNYCPNQGKIVGEMWFSPEESSTVPVHAIINFEINSPEKLIQEGGKEIFKEDFIKWKLSEKEMYAYDFQIPVENDVIDNEIVFTVILESGNNLVYEGKIKQIDSLDNCKFP